MILDFGSGPHPKPDATVHVDVYPWPGVTVIHDFQKFPYPFETDIADKIYFGDVIEHLPKFMTDSVLQEIHRILKPRGILDITCPDARWICERVAFGDWSDKANVDWLNKEDDPFENAMSYFFGGWMNSQEYQIPGMGHINAFDESKLKRLLLKAGFRSADRVPDLRNPEPARWAVLRMIAVK